VASSAFGQNSLLRPRPFDFQRFLSEQARAHAIMSSEADKARTSGEGSRAEPTLPTVNPAVEKQEPPKPALHPAFYVM